MSQVELAPLSKARIVIADDDQENGKIVEEALRVDGHQVHYAPNGEAAFHLVQSWNPHLVLLDVNMPKLSGLECLRKIRAMGISQAAKNQQAEFQTTVGDYVGVIMVTANSSLGEIIEGLDGGADDYIIKPFRVDELRARVRACLRVKFLHDALKRANKRLEDVASRDDLTSWFNMRYMTKRLAKEVDIAKHQNQAVSCIMFDMDHFKQVNDTNDHLFGSYVLTEVARIVQTHLRATDIAARYGGDEFCILLPHTSPKEAVTLANRAREAIQEHTFKSGRYAVKVTASFGVSGTDRPKEVPLFDARELVRLADSALYEAKNSGRNKVELLDFSLKP